MVFCLQFLINSRCKIKTSIESYNARQKMLRKLSAYFMHAWVVDSELKTNKEAKKKTHNKFPLWVAQFGVLGKMFQFFSRYYQPLICIISRNKLSSIWNVCVCARP